MKYKYGKYSSAQMHSTKLSIRRSIFYLLLYADPETKDKYKDIDVAKAIRNLQYKLNGLNRLLFEPPELVLTMSILETVLEEYTSESYDWRKYRKLVLDAGAEIMKIREGDQK